jgi:phosphatidate phosphatase APP1
MPELYRQLRNLLGAATGPDGDSDGHVPFFYLSASPYNLYPFLRGFRDDAGYPAGQLMLRDSSSNWTTVSGLLSALTVDTEAYKKGQMRRVRAWFPQRKMVCIGDSTQSDPEAYGSMYVCVHGWMMG